jgi:hypothetical protein
MNYEEIQRKLSGRRNRRAGHTFERDVAKALLPIFPHAKRHLEFQASEAALGVDISNTGKYRIQCKRYRKYAPLSCIEEIKPEAGTVPVLVTVGHDKPPLACLPFDEFVRLVTIAEAFGA